MEKTKIELSEVDVYFLTKGEANLLWDYDTSDSTIWQKRTDFFNSIRKQGRYVLAIDITGIWFYNFFKPKREGEKEHDVYASAIDVNCNLRTFNEWIKAKYKEKFEEDLCLTDADENYVSLKKDWDHIREENRSLKNRLEHLQEAVENSNARSAVDAYAKKKGVVLTDFTEDKDGLNKAQKLIFTGKDPFDEEIHEDEKEEVKIEDEPQKEEAVDITNWKAMYVHQIAENEAMQNKLELKDTQFKTLLELFNSREND